MNFERSIVIVPSHRFIEPETESGLRELERMGLTVERRFGNSAIDQARNQAASWAFTRPQGYEWIYWIDSDTHFDASDFRVLAEGPPLAFLPYQVKVANGGIAAMPMPGQVFDRDSSGWLEARACGFGFVKTPRSLYQALSKTVPLYQNSHEARPTWAFFQPSIWEPEDAGGRKCYYGEDFSFCFRAREAGFKLMGNFDRNIGHIGRYAYRIQDAI